MKALAPVLFWSAMLFVWNGTSHAQDSTQRRFSIDECVNTFSPGRIESTQVGYQYWFVGKEFLDGRTLKMSVVAPQKATHPPHSHGEDEFFFVFEGTAEVFLDGKSRVIGPLSSFYCPRNSTHGIRNAGETELKYLVIKKYEQSGQGKR